MTERRRRDGDDDAIDGAQAVGPPSRPTRKGRPGDGGAAEDAPRVHGAWTTPAVVVRRPDGSIVNGDDPATSPGGDGRATAHGDAGDAGAQADAMGDAAERATLAAPAGADGAAGPAAAGTTEAGRRRAPGRTPRVRPRRIPGAPGAVLLRSTLTPAADGRELRRGRRSAASSSTPLPPRPAARRGPGAQEAATAARPSLRAVSGPPVGKAGRTPVRRRARRPASRRDGSRRQRVVDAVAGLNFDRLVPGDDAARQRRAARLRKVSARLAAAAVVVLVIYGVFPVRTWIDQRAATDRARERLEVFERENELLASEKRDLSTDERIEEEAREMGFVLPGEESYGITPAPEAPPPSGTTSTTQPG